MASKRSIAVTIAGTGGDYTATFALTTIGKDGEHKNTKLVITVPSEWVLGACGEGAYMVVEYENALGAAGRSANNALPATVGTTISYEVPRDAMYAPQTKFSFNIYEPISASENRIIKSAQATVFVDPSFAARSIGTLIEANNTYVPANALITGDTKTKITYNTYGLVTAGGDAFAGYSEPVSAPVGTSRELDTTAYNVFDLKTFTAETTITFKTPSSGTRCYSMTIFITQGVTPQNIILPTIVWEGDAPTINVASKIYIITLCTIDNGTTWLELGRREYTP